MSNLKIQLQGCQTARAAHCGYGITRLDSIAQLPMQPPCSTTTAKEWRRYPLRLDAFGLEMMTPIEDHRRAGNISFMASNVDFLRSTLAKSGVLVWGAYGQFGRVRVSAHVHNDTDDVSRLLTAVEQYLQTDD